MDEQVLKDAQYRKGLSIAFFNATNAAIELCKASYVGLKENELQEKIQFWRSWMIEEHKTYYATVIANVGTNYVASETIKKINEVSCMDDLKNLWLSLSEDERRDGEIIKAKDIMKLKYEDA